MTNYDKADMRILAEARRGLGLETADAFGDPAERTPRVEFYTRQVAETGHIRTWIPRSEPDRPHRSRFAFGDALLRHSAG